MNANVIPLDVGKLTHQGRVRQQNQDRCEIFTQPNPAGQVFVVADGVGGEVHGDRASEYAVKRVAQLYYETYQQYPQHTAADLLQSVLVQLNKEVYQQAVQLNSAGHMGTTIVVAVLQGLHLTVAWLGDSRAYVISGKRRMGVQITRDHAQNGSNVLARSLGGEPQATPETAVGTLEPGDTVVLCSDGLHRYLQQGQLTDVVLNSPNAQDAAQALINMANQAGGKDNVTAVVVSVPSGLGTGEYPVANPEADTFFGENDEYSPVAPGAKKQPMPDKLLAVGGIVGTVVLLVVVLVFWFVSQQNAAVATQVAAQNTATAIAAVPLTETQQTAQAVISGAETATAQVPTDQAATVTSDAYTQAAAVVQQIDTATAAATQAIATQAAVIATQNTATAAADAQAAQPQDVPAVGQVFYVQRETYAYPSVGQPASSTLPAGTSVTVTTGTSHGGASLTYYDGSDGRYYAVSVNGQNLGWVRAADLGTDPPPTPAPEIEPTQPPPSINNFTSGSVAVTTAEHRTDNPETFFLMPELGSTQPFLVLSPGATVTSTGQRNWDGGQWWWQVAVETDEGTKTGWLEDSSLTTAPQ